MQQIERYGVIVLVFLLVTIVAISFWGDSKSPGFWSRLTGKNQSKPEMVAKIDPPALPPQIANPELRLSPAAPIDLPQPVVSLGGQEQLTPIDQPATGFTMPQAPEGAIMMGKQQVPAVSLPDTFPPTQKLPVVVEAPPTPAANEYVVQRGDSFARIARTRLGAESRWQEIAALNPKVDPKSLNVGQKLLLPAGAAKTTAPRAIEPKPVAKSLVKPVVSSKTEKSATSSRACIVQKGDTLRSIARRELGDERRWKEIASANPGLDPARLAIGMRLKLPQKGSELVAVASPAPTTSKKPRVQ